MTPSSPNCTLPGAVEKADKAGMEAFEGLEPDGVELIAGHDPLGHALSICLQLVGDRSGQEAERIRQGLLDTRFDISRLEQSLRHALGDGLLDGFVLGQRRQQVDEPLGVVDGAADPASRHREGDQDATDDQKDYRKDGLPFLPAGLGRVRLHGGLRSAHLARILVVHRDLPF